MVGLVTGAVESERVEPAAGSYPALAGTAQQGASAAAVDQSHGTEARAGIVHGIQPHTIQHLRQSPAVQIQPD